MARDVTSSHEHTTHTQNRTDDEYHADAREERTKRKGEEGSKMSASASASAAKSGSDVENPPSPSNKGALDNVADLEKKKKEEKKATNLNKKMDRLAKKERKQSFWKLTRKSCGHWYRIYGRKSSYGLGSCSYARYFSCWRVNCAT